MTEQDITTEDWIEYKNNATKYLEMHTQYATRKAIQIAIEKQIPKKPLDFGDESYLCPCCKRNNFYKGIHLDKQNYCDYCGQAIKWE